MLCCPKGLLCRGEGPQNHVCPSVRVRPVHFGTPKMDTINSETFVNTWFRSNRDSGTTLDSAPFCRDVLAVDNRATRDAWIDIIANGARFGRTQAKHEVWNFDMILFVDSGITWFLRFFRTESSHRSPRDRLSWYRVFAKFKMCFLVCAIRIFEIPRFFWDFFKV